MPQRNVATLRTVAELSRCSVAVASSVLNNAKGNIGASAVTRRRIQEAAQKLGYRPSRAARAMATRKTHHVGVLIRNNPSERIIHPLSFEFIVGINEGLEQAGYLMSLIRLTDVETESDLKSLIYREHVVDGIIVVSSLPGGHVHRIEGLLPNTIWADSDIWHEERCLRRDETQAGRLAADLLIERGHKRLLWLDVPTGGTGERHFSHSLRLAGVMESARRTNAEVVRMDVEWDFTTSQIPGLVDALRDGAGLIAENTYLARRLSLVLGESGLRIGDNVDMVCCDTSFEIDWLWPELPRVSFDRFSMGRTAAELMINNLDQREAKCPSRLLPCELIVGRTVQGLDMRKDARAEKPKGMDR